MKPFFIVKKKYNPKRSIFKYFINSFWYIPSDVLQRAIEANVWNYCRLSHPILEIGTGNGKLTEFLFGKDQIIDVGIDIEEGGLDEVRLTKKYKKVLCANAERMPFSSSSFSTVVSNSTFEHIKNDVKAIKEVSRVLKRGGLFFLTVPNTNLEEWILEYEKNGDNKTAIRKLKSFNKRANHLHYYALSEWSKIFKKNRMEIIIHKYYFKKEVAVLWYRIFKFFTKKINKKELWSYLVSPRYKRIIPKAMIIYFLETFLLKRAYEKGFFVGENEGAQLFMVAKKV